MNKMMLFLMTGDPLSMFMGFKNYLMYKLLTGGLGGLTGGTATGYTASNLLQTVAPLMLMGGMGGGGRRYYRRPRTVVYNRRYYGRRRY